MAFNLWFEDRFGYPTKNANSPAWVMLLRETFEAGYKSGESATIRWLEDNREVL